MRPLRGVVTGRGVVECENGVTYRDICIPKGIKWHDPVLVCIDMTKGCVASVAPVVPEEELADAEHIQEESSLFTCDDVPECELVETDGSGLS